MTEPFDPHKISIITAHPFTVLEVKRILKLHLLQSGVVFYMSR